MTSPPIARPAAAWTNGVRLPLPVRFAVRELRAGLKGFYVFMACIALGVAVIGGVGALADALRAGFEEQGQAILGGDATLARIHQRASTAEREWIERRGRSSETATMRAMARTVDGSEQALIELKGIDAAYPLVGSVRLAGGATLADAVRSQGGAAVDPILLERLGVKRGDRIRVGEAEVPITAVVESEPDTISDRVTFGPRVFVSLSTLERTGLVQPGSLVRWRYALLLPERDGAGLARFRDEVRAALAESGFLVADRRNPSPQVTRTLERLRQFLTLLGLTALLVGGVGIANAVATFIDRRRNTIATFKSVGASGPTVFAIFLCQVMAMAGLGIVIGLALGYLVPVLLDRIYGEALPIRAVISASPASTLSAAAYGILVSLVFTLWPLGRAELIRAGALFREEVAPERVWPRPRVIAATLAAGAALALFAVLSADARLIAIYYCLAVVAVFALFVALGAFVTWTARRVPRPRRAELALALGNLGAPGGLTRSVVLSLGTGLSLLVAVALADASLQHELSDRLPQDSPSYYVVDLPRAELPAFTETVQRQAPDARIDTAPMLRGRIVRLREIPAEEIKAGAEAQWVLSGDRGLTYAEDVPEGSRVVEGAWWPQGYEGEPLVSFEAEVARRLGLKLGDTVTVNVLGRNVTARLANLREVKWESLGINFVMVFSPNTLQAAPHNLLATIRLPEGPLSDEVRVAKAIGAAFPSVTAIRVKDAIQAFNAVFGKVMTAVRVAGSVTLLAGALVLAGALATAQRRRIKQAVILKTLGATRRRVLMVHLAEYVLLASVTASLAVLLGSVSAWLAVTQVMDLEFVFSVSAVVQALMVSLGLVLLFGAAGTWRVLGAPAVPYLRSE